MSSNSVLAKKIGVTPQTIGNWARAAMNKENDLQLGRIGGKLKPIDNEHNLAVMMMLRDDGKRYQKHSFSKNTTPDPKFYDLFSIEEQIEIVNDLKYRKFINLKFYYKNEGAQFWNEDYLEGSSTIPKEVNNLLQDSIGNILGNLTTKNVNLVDIGCGNGHPAKILLEKAPVSKYVAVDISQEMIDLCLGNIRTWKPGIETKYYPYDIEHTLFGKVLLESRDAETANLILFLGSTICNSDDRIRILRNFAVGMNKEDLLLFNFSLDTIQNRSTLNYVKPNNDYERAWIPQILGIDVKNCDVELVYNHKNVCKEKLLVLDKNYTIKVNLLDKVEEIQLLKGEKINRWKHYLLSIPQMMAEVEQSGLDIRFLARSKSNVLVGAKLKI